MWHTREEIERAERQERASKARIAHFRVIGKCPVCQENIQNRIVEDGEYSTKIKTQFRCGLIVVTDASFSKLEAPCRRPTEEALQKLGESFNADLEPKTQMRRRANRS